MSMQRAREYARQSGGVLSVSLINPSAARVDHRVLGHQVGYLFKGTPSNPDMWVFCPREGERWSPDTLREMADIQVGMDEAIAEEKARFKDGGE